MSKIGRDKKKCEKYKQSGHRETNKQLKKERNEKRIAKFAKRRAEGKAYADNNDGSGTKECSSGPNTFEKSIITERANDHRLSYARWTSIIRKLNNELLKKENEIKKMRENKKNHHNKNEKNKEKINGIKPILENIQ